MRGNGPSNLPVVVDGLDDEPECWANCVDVLAHNLLDNSGLPGIIKTSCYVDQLE